MKLDTTTQELLRDPLRRRDWVHYQLRLQGRTMASVADNAHPKPVRRQTLYQAFLRPYPRMEKLIADALGLTPQQLFPDRYDRDGLPKRYRRPGGLSNGTKSIEDNTEPTSRNINDPGAV